MNPNTEAYLKELKNEKEWSALDTQVAGSHYQMPIQPVEFIHKNGLGFLEGCVVKRVCRHRNKNGKEDLLKAIHELQLLIELEYPTSTSTQG
jgi:hypothetical protein